MPSNGTGWTTPTELPSIDHHLSSMMGLVSLALSPSSTQTRRKQASDGLSVLLPSVIMESLSMTTYTSSKASSSPGNMSQLISTLSGSFFAPIIRSFVPVSRAIYLFSLSRTAPDSLPSRTSTPINGNKHGTSSNFQHHDIRPSLLATIQRTLDSLRVVQPDLAPTLCLLTSLLVAPELRRLWFASTAGASFQEGASIQRNTNRNRTREEKRAFEKQARNDLADHDAAWHLLAVLSLCFEHEASPISTASSPLEAPLKMRLTHELTELARILCFTDPAERIRNMRAGSGPSLVEEEMVLGVYEKAWLNGWLDGPAYPEVEDMTGGPERTADVGGKENGVDKV